MRPNPSPPPPSFGQRAKRALTRFVITVLVLGLLGAVGVLLSTINARSFTLERSGDTLVVHKGRALPVGTLPYKPADPVLADAYAPLPLEGIEPSPLLAGQRFSDREELDRALFDQIEQRARPLVTSDDPQTLDRALYFVRRAQKLTGITPEQRVTLQQMEGEVAFFLARTKLDDARKLIADALTQLRLAAGSRNRHALAANRMLTEVEPSTKALEEALRKAVFTLSGPAGEGAPGPKGNAAQPGATPAAGPAQGERPNAEGADAGTSAGPKLPPGVTLLPADGGTPPAH